MRFGRPVAPCAFSRCGSPFRQSGEQPLRRIDGGREKIRGRWQP
jgi:hypothetical protein